MDQRLQLSYPVAVSAWSPKTLQCQHSVPAFSVPVEGSPIPVRPSSSDHGSPYASQPPKLYDPTDHADLPSYPQPAYSQQQQQQQQPQPPPIDAPYVPSPAYSESAVPMDQPTYNAGGGRYSPPPPSLHPSKPRESYFGFMSSKWAAVFMGATAIQAVICLCFESYVFAAFQPTLRENKDRNLRDLDSQYKTIPTFLSLFIFGFLYELVVVWDALRMKNTIQVMGVCFANLALAVYTAIQVDQISTSLDVLEQYNALKSGYTARGIWADIRPYLIAIPSIIAVSTVFMVFLAWRLYQEFAWDVLKIIGADYRMKKRFLHYQIYIALLKFDFFFFLGFIIQLVVIVTETSDPEFALTIVTIPITVLILVGAGYFTRIENKIGMVIVIIFYHGGLVYFLFKLVRIWTWRSYYEAVQKSLTAFAVITILLIVLTIINAVVCMVNFGRGLKPHIQMSLHRRKEVEDPTVASVSLHDVKPLASRMTID
ncbi:hypothetical protein GMORB2_3891 [Geosmithia morbida]|uniref:Uncharacterized protein n=1 Tax=Geosmithia morbida TaxID=1094350 RepID=A0A9P4YYV8_9HYPO|nr:uncharacterized protein GMORB2_3891 [Geosmithia morbida]KAF4125052.1 hypothetical protein GMORB2_3891 [Geosmithia morbida]